MYTVQKAKDEMKSGIRAYLLKDEKGEYRLPEVNRLPFYLIGAPGIGKTELVRQTAGELGIGFVSCSITHHTRNSVLGLPVIKEMERDGKLEKFTEYTMSELIAKVVEARTSGQKEGILLVDEFASMAESLVAPMLAFLQTKNIGIHHLPEGWILVLCSNPPEYNKTARKFDMAIMDRVRTMEITFDKNEFLKYGELNNFHPTVLEYIRSNGKDVHICKREDNGNQTIVTTRGWENLSHCLKAYEELQQDVSEDLIRQFIKSDEVSYRFYKFYLLCRTTMEPKEVREILDGQNLPEHIARHEEDSYSQKWNMTGLMSSSLADSCREYKEYEKLQIYMTNVLKELQKLMKSDRSIFSGFGNITISLPKLLMNRAGIGEEDSQMTNYGSMSSSITSWNTNPDQREIEALREIINMYEAAEKPFSEEDSSFIDVENADNTLLVDTYKKWLNSLQKANKERLPEKNEQIKNVIRFFEGIENKKTEKLVENLVQFINQENAILDILSMLPNKEYSSQLKKIYGSGLIDEIDAKLGEVS